MAAIFENIKQKKIVLASQSPRRRELLASLGLLFEIRTSNTNEDYPPGLKKAAIALHIATKKAEAIPLNTSDEIIIAADTIVCLEDVVLEKPKDKQDAYRMLRLLSGKKHEVITAVALKTADKLHAFHEVTVVEFAVLSDQQIWHYINQYEPTDKAGAYGIQEWIGHFIDKIHGSYSNVIGLPTSRLYNELLSLLNWDENSSPCK